MNAPRIALIDDDRTWLETLADLLRSRGFQVRTAVGGSRGLELLETGDVTLAVIDFNMPDLNGLELLRQLRRRRVEVGVLMLSSEDDPTLPLRAVAEGAAAFVSKGLAPAQLVKALTQALAVALAEGRARPRHASWWDRFLPVPYRRVDPQRN